MQIYNIGRYQYEHPRISYNIYLHLTQTFSKASKECGNHGIDASQGTYGAYLVISE